MINHFFPDGEFNKDLTATQQVASPKLPSATSPNPNIRRNKVSHLQAGSNLTKWEQNISKI